MPRTFIILILLLAGCKTTSKTAIDSVVVEKNKDIFILSSLIHNYLVKTNGREFSLSDLIKIDSTARISKNFQRIELKTRGGYISVFYKFSDSRNNSIDLTSKETAMINSMRWLSKNMDGLHDGEIRFDYGERFYRIKKIIVKKE